MSYKSEQPARALEKLKLNADQKNHSL